MRVLAWVRFGLEAVRVEAKITLYSVRGRHRVSWCERDLPLLGMGKHCAVDRRSRAYSFPMTVTYSDRDGVALSHESAIERPIGSEFAVEFPGGKQAVTIRVLRTAEDEWLAFRQFAGQAAIKRLQDGLFDSRQDGHQPQSTLHDAIRANLGPF